jgi:molybdopterin-guanine dinucleotide biosynthesis protein A
MTAAGARRVTVVGGSVEAAARLGLARVEDDHPGEGPLGAILTALRGADADHAWVGACDLPLVAPATRTALDAALDDATAAVACDDRSVAWLLLAVRTAEALAPLEAAWAVGERAPHRALGWAARVARPSDELRNVNRPEEAPEPS